MSAFKFLYLCFNVAVFYSRLTSVQTHQQNFISDDFDFFPYDDSVDETDSANLTALSNATLAKTTTATNDSVTLSFNITTTSPRKVTNNGATNMTKLITASYNETENNHTSVSSSISANSGPTSSVVSTTSTASPQSSPNTDTTASVASTQSYSSTTAKSVGQEIKERLEKGEVTAIVLLTLAIMVVLALLVGFGVCYKSRRMKKRRDTLYHDAYNFGDTAQEIHRELAQSGEFRKTDPPTSMRMEDMTSVTTDTSPGPSTSKASSSGDSTSGGTSAGPSTSTQQ